MTAVLAAYLEEEPFAFVLLAVALAGFLAVGARLSVIDWRTHRLPDRIVLPSYPAAILLLAGSAGAAGEWHRVLGMLVGAALLWTGFAALHLLYRRGLGFGDVKLAGLLGLYLGFAGWPALWWGPFLAILLGGTWSVALVLARRATLGSSVAFGPFLVAGAGLTLAVLR
ncbi:prepilin peptidase [Arthrobacter sp. NamB2]|uniref:prepilin peptidase n=1 Tax=Arthrobacter sp. NamB2 TaxID=2576035 RepID=UPI0010C98F77|nr:A24 family peptidase [Arthrobacter sp. NamB2]TKV28371.1 prepilin peptidase [Arthrobacter sp. NamB2]